MKRFLLSLTGALAFCAAVCAQSSRLDTFSGLLSSRALSFDYSFALQGDIPVKGEGKAAVDGDAYKIETAFVEVISDGVVRWSVDHDSKEVYVENVDASAVDYLSNPAVLLRSLSESFNVGDDVETEDGGSILGYTLYPRIKGTGLSLVRLYLDRQGRPVRMDVRLEEGAETVFRIRNLKLTEKGSVAFKAPVALFDSSYVVTDLR